VSVVIMKKGELSLSPALPRLPFLSPTNLSWKMCVSAFAYECKHNYNSLCCVCFAYVIETGCRGLSLLGRSKSVL